MITEMNSLIAQVRLSEIQVTNECFLEENEEILKPVFDQENNEKPDEEKIADFNKKKDYKLAKALENVLLISSSSDVESTFHVNLSLSSQN